ncbi:hypothetical protein HF086_015017 [Spodoptera exigua]|uniref:Uncharacterized protein n=1 Tax=Spodoptera exigua TaxID=7107 RepID=A0A922M600_SPOEX|nr:hypothetical protein HF086_015017 [Spodoptera exigua]
MKESNLLDKDDRIDYEKLRAYLDQWAEEHPNFTEAILEAKKQCAYPDGEEKDKSECEPDQIFHCKFIDEPECKELQAHVDECRPYYQKPKDQDKKMTKKGKKFRS